jgi:hypothetical protein
VKFKFLSQSNRKQLEKTCMRIIQLGKDISSIKKQKEITSEQEFNKENIIDNKEKQFITSKLKDNKKENINADFMTSVSTQVCFGEA